MPFGDDLAGKGRAAKLGYARERFKRATHVGGLVHPGERFCNQLQAGSRPGPKATQVAPRADVRNGGAPGVETPVD